jgi:hypothetical protein
LERENELKNNNFAIQKLIDKRKSGWIIEEGSF